MRQLLSKFAADESAATSIEYALIAVGISIVIVGAVQTIGTNLAPRYTSVGNALK